MLNGIKNFIYKTKETLFLIFNNSILFIINNEKKIKNLYETNYNTALFHLKNNNLRDANFRFNIIEKFWPDKIDVKYDHAICLLAMKRKNKAIDKLNEILKINPNYELAKKLLSELNNENNQSDIISENKNNN